MDKPWTMSRGPIVANELDIRKADAVNALLVRNIAILPSKPGDPIKPFALGLWNDIRALMKPDGSATALRRATGAFLHSKRYYFATAQPDSIRHDVDGNPVEDVSAADRLAAQQRFMNLKQDEKTESKPVAVPPPPPEPVLTKAELIRASLLRKKSTTSPSVTMS